MRKKKLNSIITDNINLIENKTKIIEKNEQLINELNNRCEDALDRCSMEIKKRKDLEVEIRELKGSVLVCARIRPRLSFEVEKLITNGSRQPSPTNNDTVTNTTNEFEIDENNESAESNENESDIVTMFRDEREVLLTQRGGNGIARFEFDEVFSPMSSQKSVCCVATDVVPGLLRGQCIAIMAYGQTGSGKTYTMEGPKNDITKGEEVDHYNDDDSNDRTSSELACILKRRRRMSDSGIVVEGNISGGSSGSSSTGGEKTGSSEVTSSSSEERKGDSNNNDDDEKEVGIYEAVLKKLFDDIKQKDFDQKFVESKKNKSKKKNNNKNKSTVDVTMQILEVYNEIVYDLSVKPELQSDGTYIRKQVIIKQSGRTGRTHVPDAISVPVHNYNDASTVLKNGLSSRRSASHAMNVQSSRSHVIVHVKCVIRREDDTRAFGQLFLVDLAGSEQVKKSEGIDNKNNENIDS